jgi:3'-phosphoadenosine 5'-phosphosulfate sulfotransferase (PAPS reductase)/FAD synthetase
VFGWKRKDSFHGDMILREYIFEQLDIRLNRAYPLANWSNKDVINYLEMNTLPLPVHYKKGERNSGMNISKDHLIFLCDNCPADYQKTIQAFPFAETQLYI